MVLQTMGAENYALCISQRLNSETDQRNVTSKANFRVDYIPSDQSQRELKDPKMLEQDKLMAGVQRWKDSCPSHLFQVLNLLF